MSSDTLPVDARNSLVKLSFEASSWTLVAILFATIFLWGALRPLYQRQLANGNNGFVYKVLHHAMNTNVLPTVLSSFTLFNLPTFTLAKLYFYLFIFAIVAVFSLSTDFSPGAESSYNRFGHITFSLLLFTFTLSSRSLSPFVHVLKIPQYSILSLHKFISFLAVVCVTIHFSLHISYWSSLDFVSDNLERPIIRYGLTAYISFLLILVLSSNIVRRKVYKLFYASHVILYTLIVVFIYLHTDEFKIYLILIAIFHFMDRAARGMKLQKPSWIVEVKQYPDLQVTKLVVHHGDILASSDPSAAESVSTDPKSGTNRAAQPGSYAHIMFPPVPVTHPFTIAQSTHTSSTLIVKSSGAPNSFTSKLLSMQHDKSKPLKIGFEGPFSEGYRLDLFESVVLVATGIGITPWMSWLESFVRQWEQLEKGEGDVKTKKVVLVWIVKDLNILQLWTPPSHPNLVTIIYTTSSSSSNPGPSTQATPEIPLPQITGASGETPSERQVSPSYVHRNGRPKMNAIVEELAVDGNDRGLNEMVKPIKESNNVAVAVCAPYPVLHDMRNAVSTLRKRNGKLWWVFSESFEV
ncbi:hypothetical protein BKA69DRAFT_1123263 [Paraphysoderma sedebokerense]|nr:hypothetical protein BKA69DRAFT_1123263 [Paraphysoderma sedebokerense]